jgi:aminoglycoside phosphotransferase (APT) family kinase protein
LRELIDSTKLATYLRLNSRYHSCSLVPRSATGIRVSELTAFGGQHTNRIYSFFLEYTDEGLKQSKELILKVYDEDLGLDPANYYHYNEDKRKYVREFQTMQRLEHFAFPVPHVFLCECDSFFLGRPFMIMQKEKGKQSLNIDLSRFAATLARLHSFDVDKLGIKALQIPKDRNIFAKNLLIYYRHFLDTEIRYSALKKEFEVVIQRLKANVMRMVCPEYRLIHGDYHPQNVLIHNSNMEILDWEGVAVGDPAFDVGYAYHMIKIMNNIRNPDLCENAAERFISEYMKNSENDISQRLEFFKVVGVLGLSLNSNSVSSNPIRVYKRYGLESFIALPFLRNTFFANAHKRTKYVKSRAKVAEYLVARDRYFESFFKATFR